MKLIIDIPEDAYKNIIQRSTEMQAEGYVLECAVLNGILLDDVKAIMEKQIERDFAFAETETLKVPCHYGTANGLQVAVRILDNIGKKESEE